jgi:2-polyprenyl-3-methyl-5-hydroxy-6-metoxy-1,4-benzoquinol methylase
MVEAHGYADKLEQYFIGERRDIVDRLPEDRVCSVLEIGCGDGSTGALARKMGKCDRYVGVELMSGPAEVARTRLDTVYIADIEQFELPDPPASYDVLIASEVLEHLVDPWRVLSRLRTALKPGALVFASSPNIAHHSTIHMLLRGDWKLEDSGRMDRTHLRWFTPRTYEEMFQKCGYEVVSIESVAAPRLKPRLFNFVTGKRFDYLFMSQIFITARAP